MTEPIWNRFLTARDKEVFGTSGSGYGARAGFGKRPALLIIDVNYNFCGDRPEPIVESIKRWPNSCGEEAWVGVAEIKKLVVASRAKGLPMIYTTSIFRADDWDIGGWAWKNSRSAEWAGAPTTNLDGNAIMPEIAPGPRDIVIKKQKPSAFFGTPLHSYLTLLGCDSLLVTGATTSGCVRASVIDAFSNNFRVTIAEECCFDRSQASHAINLCDMNAKYADVVPAAEVSDYINKLPPDMFDLPKGVGHSPE